MLKWHLSLTSSGKPPTAEATATAGIHYSNLPQSACVRGGRRRERTLAVALIRCRGEELRCAGGIVVLCLAWKRARVGLAKRLGELE